MKRNGSLAFVVLLWLALGIGISLIPVGFLFQIGLWMIFVGLTTRFVLVLVPEVTGLVLLNALTGNLRSIDQGLHTKFLWELVREKNFISLEVVTEKFEETYAAKDGPLMSVKGSYQYHPDPRRLDSFIKVDRSTIKTGFTDMISSALSAIIGGKSAEEAREKIKEIELEIVESLSGKEVVCVQGVPMSLKAKLENDYGVNFKLVAIADIDFSADYQEMRSGQARVKKLNQIIGDFKAGKDITDKDAANLVLVEQGKAHKTIYEVEGLNDMLGGLFAALKGGK